MALTTYEVFIGNFGSGKTELSVNHALKSAGDGFKTALVDMDIVNPYFRSSVQRAVMEEAGVTVLATSYADKGVDLPSIPAEFSRIFKGEFDKVVIDVGGDPIGAKVLGRFNGELTACRRQVNMSMVVNITRPMTMTAPDIKLMARQIEDRARLRIDWLINNSNLAEETTSRLLLEGQELLEQVSQETGIPVRCMSGTAKVLEGLKKYEDKWQKYRGAILETSIYMRPDWLSRPCETLL